MERRLRPRGALRSLAAAVMVALGAGAVRAGEGCGWAEAGAVAVAGLGEGIEVALGDGRLVRLAGIVAPRAGPAAPDLAGAARAALAAWLAAGPVALRGLAAEPDRWGRVAGLLVRPGGADGGAGAAEALLAAGLVRVRPEPGLEACLPALLAVEAAARAAGRGLWADPHYAVLAPGDAAGLAAQAGDLALVEGILHVHASRGGSLYLALGRDRWGFAAVVSRRDAARFARAGLVLGDYEGTPVRLRGDLDARFGPRMRLAEPGAFESLEPGTLAEAPDAKHWTARARPR